MDYQQLKAQLLKDIGKREDKKVKRVVEEKKEEENEEEIEEEIQNQEIPIENVEKAAPVLKQPNKIAKGTIRGMTQIVAYEVFKGYSEDNKEIWISTEDAISAEILSALYQQAK